METAEVLVVGAGPTGLVLALWLTRLGVRVRVVDAAAAPGTSSRALAVQARVLESYRQIGLADELVARGLVLEAVNLWVHARHVARVPFGAMGAGKSPYPFLLILPQDEHERLLIGQLEGEGVQVERSTKLVGLVEEAGGVRARLEDGQGVASECAVPYLAGCDGARSAVRQALGASFPGGTYEHLFYVADVQAGGRLADGELHVALDTADFLAAFPLKSPPGGARRARLIGTAPAGSPHEPQQLEWTDVDQSVIRRLGSSVERVNWFSTYHVHHRVAPGFRRGRAFLLGDAAHIHSPVGGQGMNTGIGDAVNLAWKLAAVLRGQGAPALLDSYDPERRAFALRLVATTDRLFQLATRDGPVARRVRVGLVPRLMPALFGLARVRAFMFGTVSQTRIAYRSSELSTGAGGAVHGGDRLPWVPAPSRPGNGDNFAPLGALAWQVHVYGSASPEVRALCAARRLPLHQFGWSAATESAGLRRDCVYLVRPDGYVGLADPAARPASLGEYLDKHGLTFPPPSRSKPEPS